MNLERPDDQLREQIRRNMQEFQTEELVEIWTVNDRVAWSELAFEVIAEILRKRLGQLPPQAEAIYTYPDEPDVEEEEEAFEEADGQPVFYDPVQVLQLSDWLNWAAKAGVIVAILAGLPGLYSQKNTAFSFFVNSTNPYRDLWAWVLTIAVGTMEIVLSSLLVYFPLKALASILTILMEMEYNSRE